MSTNNSSLHRYVRLRGEKHHSSKLTEADVQLIRELWNEGEKLRARLRQLSIHAIARKFEVNPSTIADVINYTTWRHVK